MYIVKEIFKKGGKKYMEKSNKNEEPKILVSKV